MPGNFDGFLASFTKIYPKIEKNRNIIRLLSKSTQRKSEADKISRKTTHHA